MVTRVEMPKSVSTTPFCRPLAWLIQDGSHVSSKNGSSTEIMKQKISQKLAKVYNSCFFWNFHSSTSIILINDFMNYIRCFGSSHVRFGQCDVPGKGRASLVRNFRLVHWDLVGVKTHFFAYNAGILPGNTQCFNEMNSTRGNSHHLWLLAGSKHGKHGTASPLETAIRLPWITEGSGPSPWGC